MTRNEIIAIRSPEIEAGSQTRDEVIKEGACIISFKTVIASVISEKRKPKTVDIKLPMLDKISKID